MGRYGSKRTHQPIILAKKPHKRPNRPLVNGFGDAPITSESTLVQALFKGDTTALARAITLVESNLKKNHEKAQYIIENCLARPMNSIRIGITGAPGVGKSTFIEQFGQLLATKGKKIAVLAIDPSSTQSKGSILGDKTRMAELAKHPNVFIRPSPAGDTLGGIGRRTRETITLCEAAGYDLILVETVGVGQNETALHDMVDFFLVLMLPGAGDSLQGIKRGIIELADAILVNKADGDFMPLAKIACSELTNALYYFKAYDDRNLPRVLTCSALENRGMEEIWTLIATHIDQAKRSGNFVEKRRKQDQNWLLRTLNEQLQLQFYQNPQIKQVLEKMTEQVAEGKISPFTAAEVILGASIKN